MKALMKTAEGVGNFSIVDLDVPELIGDEVLIKAAFAGICGTDIHVYKGVYGKAPVVVGHEFSGVVEKIGPDVKHLKVGQRVTSETSYSTCGVCPSCETKDYNLCSTRLGLGTTKNGGMAEYVISRESIMHVLPDNVTLLAGALTEPLACGVHAAIEKADVQTGDTICIFGSSTIGLMVAQVAKARGAYVMVAGLDADEERFDVAEKMGVDRTVNQMKEDIEAVAKEVTDGRGIDIAFECAGAVAAANKGIKIVKKKGKVIQMGVFPSPQEKIETDMILHREIEYIGSRSQKPSSWVKSIELLGEGIVSPEKVVTDVVDLERWEDGFKHLFHGEGIKTVIRCNTDFSYDD